jgi:protein-S-isoprenylcysteine O-methyltransferase Ste14
MESSIRIIIGVISGIFGLVMLISSRVNLGKSFTVKTEARPLVTTGIYSKIQHPLYTFLDVLLAAIIIITGLPFLLIFWIILAAIHIIQMRREEKVLAAAHGDIYQTYRSSTWL